jgi:hypothetical protein
MPTASRLTAAAFWALLAFVLSRQIMPRMPEGMAFGYFIYVNMTIAVVVGWKIMGSRAGRGVTAGINNGLTGVAALILWGLFVHSCYEMFDQAMHNRFDGPFEALLSIIEIGAEYAMVLLTPVIILTALIGGALSGLATEFASRHSR